jgi:hypothetical protein
VSAIATISFVSVCPRRLSLAGRVLAPLLAATSVSAFSLLHPPARLVSPLASASQVSFVETCQNVSLPHRSHSCALGFDREDSV